MYLWSAATSRVVKLCELNNNRGPNSVASVAWSTRGSFLAVGTNNNETQIWDVNKSAMCVSLHPLGPPSFLTSIILRKHCLQQGLHTNMVANKSAVYVLLPASRPC